MKGQSCGSQVKKLKCFYNLQNCKYCLRLVFNEPYARESSMIHSEPSYNISKLIVYNRVSEIERCCPQPLDLHAVNYHSTDYSRENFVSMFPIVIQCRCGSKRYQQETDSTRAVKAALHILTTGYDCL